MASGLIHTDGLICLWICSQPLK